VLCVLALAACSEGKRADPTTSNRNEETPNAVSRTANCGANEVRVVFAPERVVVTDPFGVELAHATDGNRDITGPCTAAQPPGKASQRTGDPVTAPTTLDCKTSLPMSINVHPEQLSDDPAILASLLVVYVERGARPVRIVALARLDRDNPGLLVYDPDACSPG
jgi:hypothetical protein